jgi:hypothetical protein
VCARGQEHGTGSNDVVCREDEWAELADIVRRHGDYFLALAERAERELTGSDQLVWLRALRLENDNLRVCLSRAGERGDIESVARVAAALRDFWGSSGQIREGEGWMSAVLDEPLSANLRARVLVAAGVFADRLSLGTAAARFDEAIAIGEQADPRTFALALAWRCVGAGRRGESGQVRVDLGEQAVRQAQQAGDAWATAYALNILGCAIDAVDDGARAVALFEESIALFRRCGDRREWGSHLSTSAPWPRSWAPTRGRIRPSPRRVPSPRSSTTYGRSPTPGTTSASCGSTKATSPPHVRFLPRPSTTGSISIASWRRPCARRIGCGRRRGGRCRTRRCVVGNG